MGMHIPFKIYRYQLLPLDRNNTKDLFNNVTSDSIIARKNEYFSEAISSLPTHRLSRSQTIVDVQLLQSDFFHLTFAPSRPLTRETAEYKKEQVENWPHIEAYILNSPQEQYLLIQNRPSAFANTDTVAKMIIRGTRLVLESAGLSLKIEPLFNKAFFWDLVKEYKNRITWVEFEFITPNMANISNTLADTLKSLSKDMNAVQEKLALTAEPISSLDISPDNATIQGLVDYTSQGGGDITLKIRGMRQKIQTSNSTREVSISGLELTASPAQLRELFRDELK